MSIKTKFRFCVTSIMFVICIWGFTVNADTSSELSIQRTDTDDGYRLDYIDDDGCITLAEDKGYSTVVYEVENNHWISEYYYDEYMNPVSPNRYHGILYEYENGYCSKLTFVDYDDKPTTNSLGYSIRLQKADEGGRVIQENYLDTNGNPIAINGGYYGIIREKFSDDGRVLKYSYLDYDNSLYLFNDCYCTIMCSYSKDGFVEREFYFDINGEHTKNSDGVFGIEYIRNEDGKDVGIICLDSQGNRMTCTSGYSIMLYSRNELNQYAWLRYYDTEGNPIELSHGQHLEIRLYSETEVSETIYYDIEGNFVFSLSNFLQNRVLVNLSIAILILILGILVPKKMKYVLLVLYSVFVIYMTFIIRDSHTYKMNLNLLQTYQNFLISASSRKEIINNVILFIPLGALLYSLSRSPRVILIPVLFSIIIEVLQFLTGLGVFELNDILENSLGGVFGFVFCFGIMALLRINSKKQ